MFSDVESWTVIVGFALHGPLSRFHALRGINASMHVMEGVPKMQEQFSANSPRQPCFLRITFSRLPIFVNYVFLDSLLLILGDRIT